MSQLLRQTFKYIVETDFARIQASEKGCKLRYEEIVKKIEKSENFILSIFCSICSCLWLLMLVCMNILRKWIHLSCLQNILNGIFGVSDLKRIECFTSPPPQTPGWRFIAGLQSGNATQTFERTTVYAEAGDCMLNCFAAVFARLKAKLAIKEYSRQLGVNGCTTIEQWSRQPRRERWCTMELPGLNNCIAWLLRDWPRQADDCIAWLLRRRSRQRWWLHCFIAAPHFVAMLATAFSQVHANLFWVLHRKRVADTATFVVASFLVFSQYLFFFWRWTFFTFEAFKEIYHRAME